MASNQFKSAAIANATTSGSILYTVPSGKKAFVLDVAINNTTATVVDYELIVTVASISSDVKLKSDSLVLSDEPIKGRKIVLMAGDVVKVKASVANSINAMISVLEDVN